MKSLRIAIGTMAIAAIAISGAHPAVAMTSVPFKDPNANGYIGFCDQKRQQVTSGSIYDQPFIWTAVSSTKAPAGYEHGKAVLVAFQPRENLDPGYWSGSQMTASSTFTNPKHPMSQATYGDSPLLYFIQAYPPKWQGLVQLRLSFSAIGLPVYKVNYPATTVQVMGDRWSVVDGGPVDCYSGTAKSIESRIPSEAVTSSPPPLDPRASSAASSQPTTGPSQQTVAAGHINGGASGGTWVAVGLIAVAVIGSGAAGAFAWRKRRSVLES